MKGSREEEKEGVGRDRKERDPIGINNRDVCIQQTVNIDYLLGRE